ncbi:hypothetical protein PtA15_8A133 [Puccinia triticina]|uniref:Uncharacterized protein n=1 Tax=Puccinia triticina TaxID=208348 RepID=A0ABY7CPQ9_9BASI|nr:uncharacterized protein PtA15_8A133 [Puccinia triticina]WAQ87231.1 hypothetical protein PtA15_8A133 [Puccinia triticina]
MTPNRDRPGSVTTKPTSPLPSTLECLCHSYPDSIATSSPNLLLQPDSGLNRPLLSISAIDRLRPHTPAMLPTTELKFEPDSPTFAGQDRLRFFGKFIPVSKVRQYFRLPNGQTPQSSKSYASLSGVWSQGKKIFPVNLIANNHSNTPLTEGQLYVIEGEIRGINFMRVPKLTWTAGDERNLNVDKHPSEWQRVRVSGLSTIIKVRTKAAWPESNGTLISISVEHTGELDEGGVFRVQCVLGLSNNEFPRGTTLFPGGKIKYKGFLDGFGRTSRRMIVEVTHATFASDNVLFTDSDKTASSLNNDF